MPGCIAPSAVSPPPAQASALAPPLGWDLRHNLLFATYSATKAGIYDIMVFCEPGNLAIYYRLPADAPAMTAVTFASGALTHIVAATSYPETLSLPPDAVGLEPKVATVVQTGLSTADPIAARFLATGELAISAGAYHLEAKARPEDLPKFRAKLDTCQRPRR